MPKQFCELDTKKGHRCTREGYVKMRWMDGDSIVVKWICGIHLRSLSENGHNPTVVEFPDEERIQHKMSCGIAKYSGEQRCTCGYRVDSDEGS